MGKLTWCISLQYSLISASCAPSFFACNLWWDVQRCTHSWVHLNLMDIPPLKLKCWFKSKIKEYKGCGIPSRGFEISFHLPCQMCGACRYRRRDRLSVNPALESPAVSSTWSCTVFTHYEMYDIVHLPEGQGQQVQSKLTILLMCSTFLSIGKVPLEGLKLP